MNCIIRNEIILFLPKPIPCFKGCYAYHSRCTLTCGDCNEGFIFYGNDGTVKEMQEDVTIFAFRPPGYDCQKNQPNTSMYYKVSTYFTLSKRNFFTVCVFVILD